MAAAFLHYFLLGLTILLYGGALGFSPQPNILSGGKRNALFLWVNLKPGVKLSDIVQVTTPLQEIVESLSSSKCPISHNFDRPQSCGLGTFKNGSSEEILAGVGYGSDLFQQLTEFKAPGFRLKSRLGRLGKLPSTGGDIFVHAKSDDQGILFELSRIIVRRLQTIDSIFNFDDVYGFNYKDGRDLSGFVDGTENLKLMDKRREVVLDSGGGAFGITQKWRHDMDFIDHQSKSKMESFIGRRMNDSVELNPKSITSHVARMTSGAEFEAQKPVRMFRQSMPYGQLARKKSGLFFIGFANDFNNFEYFLNRMTSSSASDSLDDDVMQFSKCLTGNYWYFPSREHLNLLNKKFLESQNKTKVELKFDRITSQLFLDPVSEECGANDAAKIRLKSFVLLISIVLTIQSFIIYL